MGCSKSSTETKIYRGKCLLLKRRKISNQWLNFTPHRTRIKTNWTQSLLKEENNKDQSRDKWNREQENIENITQLRVVWEKKKMTNS